MHYLLREAALPQYDGTALYRGMARRDISHVLDSRSPLHGLWLEELPRIGNDEWDIGYTNKEDAVRFLSVIRRHGLAFECIAVCACATAREASNSQSQCGFIGYDVANVSGESILAPDYLYGTLSVIDDRSIFASVQQLCKTAGRLLVNDTGLVPSFDEASLLQQVITALVEHDGDKRYCGDMSVYAIIAIA